MSRVLSYKRLINKLENEKFDIMIQCEDNVTILRWQKIDQKLTRLYRWWAMEVNTLAQRKKDEVVEQWKNP